METPKRAVAYCVHDDHYYLDCSLNSFRPAGPAFVFVSNSPWHMEPGNWQKSVEAAELAGATVVIGEWTSELDQRKAALAHLESLGFQYAFIPDGDEVIEAELLAALVGIADAGLADRVYIEWDTYWKSPEYVIRPREGFVPAMLIKLGTATPVGGRNFEGGRHLLLNGTFGIVHHLSWVGPEERILRKLSTWGHALEVLPNWYEQIWKAWDNNKLLRSLHPTHPAAYEFSERVQIPAILEPALQKYRSFSAESVSDESPAPPTCTVSVVIPHHSDLDGLRACLESLSKCDDLLKEIVIIDNGSGHGLDGSLRQPDKTKVIRLEANVGFPKACNLGFAETAGEVVIFLNDDTIVPRSGLIELLRSLHSSGTVGAAGPFTNNSGHFQKIVPTYTSTSHLDLFAEDFATRKAPDVETDMLVGFCLAAKRSVLDEVGGFDEEFGLGTFEDNDLCYRLRRAGYKLLISAKSFIHHKGSQTLGKVVRSPRALLSRNLQLFIQKWRDDLETGFASHLSGLSGEPIQFAPRQKPENRLSQVKNLAEQADISLCMIAKNEERVIRDALTSANPFFKQVIVVDTGSTDRTKEIAAECGAEVHEYPWDDSFSNARNESLKHATGKWIIWIDCDDTIPWQSGMNILTTVLNAPREIIGFVVPVQFVDSSDLRTGTRVDHVKLFRNHPKARFEHRIHEQILPALNKLGGGIARCDAVVLHSGYDNSTEGQSKKRERDFKLLELELNENPEHPFTNFNLGMTHHFAGDLNEAVRYLKRSIELAEPQTTYLRKAWTLLANSYIKLNHIDEAIQAYEQGLKSVPNDSELHFEYARALRVQGRNQEALEQLNKIMGPNTEAFTSVDVSILGWRKEFEIALAHLDLGNWPEARESLIASMNETSGRFEPALTLFEQAMHRADYKAASIAKQQIEDVAGQGFLWVKMSFEYAVAILGPHAAFDWLQNFVTNNPANQSARVFLAERLLTMGQRDMAVPHLRVLDDLEEPWAALCMAKICLEIGDRSNALLWLERTLDLDPENEEAKNLRAENIKNS